MTKHEIADHLGNTFVLFWLTPLPEIQKKNQINKSYIRSKILIDVLDVLEKHLHYHVKINVSLPPQSSISRKGLQLYYKKLELNFYHIPEPLELMSLLE